MTVALKSGQWFWDSQTSGPGAIHRDGTFMVIGNIDSAGADQQAMLEGLQPGDVLHLDHVDDPDGWWAYTVANYPEYTYHQSGVQAAGQTVILQGYFVLHGTDRGGHHHDWVADLTPGTRFRYGDATYTVSKVNLSNGVLPQGLIDTMVASGLTLVLPVEATPTPPADGAVLSVGLSPVTGGGALPPVADVHLVVDNYSGGFIRVLPAPDAATTVDFALATVPGPGGAVYPALADIPGGAAVWADFSGNLGRLKKPDGSGVYGSDLKEWIRRGAVYNVTKDSTDPAHPNLIVGAEVPPPPPADVTRVKVTSGGHGPTANPAEGSAMLVTFMLMAGPTAPPVTPPSLAAQAVADYLGVPYADQRMEVCALAAQAWVEKRRSKTDRSELWLDSSVVLGAVMYAALLYQQRAQPQGFPGMDALGTFSEDTGAAMSQIFRLVGADVVIA